MNHEVAASTWTISLALAPKLSSLLFGSSTKMNPDLNLRKGVSMNNPLYNTHVKLLAFDLLSLSQSPSPASSEYPISFSRRGVLLSRTEILGTVTSREFKPHKFLKFTIDDGTGCVSCVLWLNQLSSPYFSRRNPADVKLIADLAEYEASEVKLGVLARVRGRITAYRGTVQITVSNVIVERDPNMEILHWLDCIKLARKCYDVMPHGK